MEENKSITSAYVLMFDRLPPLLQTMDYENDFYQDLMTDALINEQPITEETIEKALKEKISNTIWQKIANLRHLIKGGSVHANKKKLGWKTAKL